VHKYFHNWTKFELARTVIAHFCHFCLCGTLALTGKLTIPQSSHFLFFFQKYSELAQDLIFINHELQEPHYGDIALLSSRPQGVTPSLARKRKSAPTTPSMPIQKRGVGFASPTIMKTIPEQNVSMNELIESAARMGLTDIQMNVGGVSIPIL
jgi:hypothetical protein